MTPNRSHQVNMFSLALLQRRGHGCQQVYIMTRAQKRWPSPELQSEKHPLNRLWWPHHRWEIRHWNRDRICHQKKERWGAGETEITASTTETLLYWILLLSPRLSLSFTWRKQWLSEVKQLCQFHITEEGPEPTQTWALDFIPHVLNHCTLLPATHPLTGHSLTMSPIEQDSGHGTSDRQDGRCENMRQTKWAARGPGHLGRRVETEEGG